jgi:hypothetical protein
VAARERKELLRSLPYLKVVAPALLQSSVVIKLDGAALDAARLGVELAVDPGEHVIEVSAADGTKSEVRVTLQAREHKNVVLSPVGVAAARIETTQAAPQDGEGGGKETTAGAASPPYLAYAALGVGLVGVGVGSVAGMRALDHKRAVDDECKGAACSSLGKDEADAGKTAALVSTVGFGVGAVGLGAALVLLLTHGSEPASGRGRPRVMVSFPPRSIAVTGGF